MCRENDLALKRGLGEVGFLGGGGDLVRHGTRCAQVKDDLARLNLHAAMGDLLAVRAIQAVRHAENRGEALDAQAFRGRERGKLLVFQVGRALAMVAGDLRSRRFSRS